MSALRAGLIALVVAGVALVAAVVLLAGGSDDGDGRAAAPRVVTPAAPACVKAWNADAKQTELGRHEASEHQVTKAWVLMLGFDGKTPAAGQGDCAVVFPGPAFGERADEPNHVAQIKNGDVGWQPVRTLPAVTADRIRELQSAAAERANVTLGGDGRLTAQ